MTPKRFQLALVPVLVAAGGLILAACSGGDDAAESVDTLPTTEPTTSSSTSTSTTPPTTVPPPTLPPPSVPAVPTTVPDVLRMPLTGEPLSDPSEIPDRPALAVKVDNVGAARPQSGINEADIVFEEIINDASTRFALVFHSQDVDPVGPVRSGRYPDIQILEAFNRPLFVWSGGNGGVTYYIDRSQMVSLSATKTSGYYRRSGRKSPQNLYTSTDVMWGKAPEDAEIPPVVFQYFREGDTLPTDDASAATAVEVTLDSVKVRWEYDAEKGQYFRFHGDRPHNTENSGQVWTDNLIVMKANYLQSPIDAKTPDAQMLGTNPVYIFSGGTVREGVWLRFASTDRYAFYTDSTFTTELRIPPGRTFVEIPRNIDGNLDYGVE